METSNWTGPLPDLSEDTKSFLDDLYDQQIINLSKHYIQPTFLAAVFTNRHGRSLGFTYGAMVEAQLYCKYLIAIEAVKIVEKEDQPA